MDNKTLGAVELGGGVLALLASGGSGYSGMMGMMGGSYSMMNAGGGLGVSILAIVFIIVGILRLTDSKR